MSGKGQAAVAEVGRPEEASVKLPRLLGTSGRDDDPAWGFKIEEDAQAVADMLRAVWDIKSTLTGMASENGEESALVIEAEQEITPAEWEQMRGVALVVERLHLRIAPAPDEDEEPDAEHAAA